MRGRLAQGLKRQQEHWPAFSSSEGLNAVAIALGANLVRFPFLSAELPSYSDLSQSTLPHTHVQGDRYRNFLEALARLPGLGVKVLGHSRLYESAPALVLDQPPFLNAAVLAETALSPLELLTALKRVESELGRSLEALRYGPRPLDLDIIAYNDLQMHSERLTLPHAAWRERGFVKTSAGLLHTCPSLGSGNRQGLLAFLREAQQEWQSQGGEGQLGSSDLSCVLPLLRHRRVLDWQGSPLVMGILNVTPDSFSDGGQLASPEAVCARARVLLKGGAAILDVGGQSTRPGAARVSAEEEAERVLPALRGEGTKDAVLSVDTFHASVAAEAVSAGADLVNDVSGGTLDEGMLSTVARLGVPYVLMHMRGDPLTMQSAQHSSYGDVVAEVAAELEGRVARALGAGIESWRLLLDPGIGFAKGGSDSLRLLGGLPSLREQLSPLSRTLPLLVGASRKGFLGSVTGKKGAQERDAATAAATAVAVLGGANIVRVHNPEANRDAVAVASAVLRSSGRVKKEDA